MTRRDRRLRWTDLLGILGLVLVLTWAPGYLAQDDVGREVSGALAFKIPPPRIGDRLVQEWVVQVGDKPPEGTGVAVVSEHRAPNREERPELGGFVRETRFLAVDQDFGPVSLIQPPYMSRERFDADGSPIYLSYTGVPARFADAVQEPTEGHWRNLTMRAFFQPALRDLQGTTYAHRPGLIDRLLESRYDPDFIVPEGRRVRGGVAATLEGRLLFAADRALLELPVLEPVIDTFSSTDDRPCARKVLFIESNGALPLSSFALDGGFTDGPCRLRSWTWYGRGFPTELGIHSELRGRDDSLLVSVDLLPRESIRGTGPAFAVREDHRAAYESTTERRGDIAWRPLHALDADERPLLRGITLGTLRDIILEQDASVSARRVLENGGHVVSWLWREDGHDPVVPSSDAPLPVGPAAASAAFHTYWRVGVAHSDGSVAELHLTIHDRRDGTFEVEDVREACGGAANGCAAVVPLDQQVPDPWPLLDEARRAIDEAGLPEGPPDAARPGAFAFMPFRGAHDERPWGDAYPDARPTGGPHLFIPLAAQQGRVEWLHGREGHADLASDGVAGSVDMADGRPVWESRWTVEPTPATAGPGEAGHRATAAAPRMLQPVPEGPAIAGLLLVAVALAARTLLAVKLGAAPYVWLYAKIKPDEVLRHERRAAIAELLRVDPGVTASEVRERLGYGWGATVHHLETMRRSRMVVAHTIGSRRHYFLPDGRGENHQVAVAASRDPELRRVLASLREREAADATELADALGRSRSHASRLANRLVRLGILRKERQGRRTIFRRQSE